MTTLYCPSWGFVRTLLFALGGILALHWPVSKALAQQQREEKFPGRIFLVSAGQNDPLLGITALDPNTRAFQPIIKEWDQWARVSPDGRWVAMSMVVPREEAEAVTALLGPDGWYLGVWVFDIAGKEQPVQVFDGPRSGVSCWSPDSKELLISAGILGADREVWRVSIDGPKGKRQKLPFGKTVSVLDWSLDGRWLVTCSGLKATGISVHLVHPDGTGDRLVLDSVDPVPEFGGILGYRPRFSPDSRKILFDHAFIEKQSGRPFRVTATSLIVLDVDGGPPRQFLERKGHDLAYHACWSPDGKAVAVIVVEGEGKPLTPKKSHVEVVNMDGRLLRSISLPGPSFGLLVFDWR